MKQRTRFKRRISRKLDAFRRSPLSFSLIPFGYYQNRPHLRSRMNEWGTIEFPWRYIEQSAML